MSFIDLKAFVSNDASVGAKLMKLGDLHFFDFRTLEKNGPVLKPTKNGICLSKKFLDDFVGAFSELMAGGKTYVVGHCSMWVEDEVFHFQKWGKHCRLDEDQATFVLDALEKLSTEEF